MATARASGTPPAPRDFGPTLPALLRRRFGVRESVTTMGVLALAAAILAGVLVHSYATQPRQLVSRAEPTFNLQYSPTVMHRVRPARGDLVRLEARRGTLVASITVTRFSLPGYGHSVVSGLLPAYASLYEKELRRGERNFLLREEGSATVNSAQGYQVGFRSGPAGHFTWGRDILLVPRDANVREGVVLALRQRKRGAITKRDNRWLDDVRRTFKSFDFGVDRAPW